MKIVRFLPQIQELAVALVTTTVLLVSPCWAIGVDLELGMRHEENLTRAELEVDQEHDTAIVLGAFAHQIYRIDPLSYIRVEAGLGGRWWTRFDDVSQLSGELGVRYKRRAGLDFSDPWIELSLSLVGLKHRKSEIRDGGVLRGGAVIARRFGHRVTTRLGYGYSVRRAVEDVVFDLVQHELFGQVDWQVSDRWLLYFELGAIEGELFSTASLPSPQIRAHANAVPVEPDAAFGRGLNPIANGLRPRWTYQIDGVVLNGQLGINYPLRPGVAIDVAAKYVQAYAAGDNEYDGFIVNAGLLWQF